MRDDSSHKARDTQADPGKFFIEASLDRRRALLVLGSAVGFIAGCTSDDPEGTLTAGSGGAGSLPGGAGGDATGIAGSGGAGGAGGAAEWASGGTARLAASYPDPFVNPLGSACRLTCFSTIGPCYASTIERKDISEGYPGLPVRLALLVVDEACTPLAGVTVDIWHTRNSGLYSADDTGLNAPAFGPPPDAGLPPDAGSPAGPGALDAGAAGGGFSCTLGDADAESHRFFRGVQTTDAKGRVDFDTCYPGWYPGRALHIHFTVRRNGEEYVTSQLYFPEDLTNEVLDSHPDYRSFGRPDTTNSSDGIFQGPDEVLEVQRQPDGTLLAYKTLVLRSSLDTQLCGSDFLGGPPPPASEG
jgi:protocatechuate 3,4-dioxygenase beta subunit